MLGLSQTGGSTDLAIYTASALPAWKKKEEEQMNLNSSEMQNALTGMGISQIKQLVFIKLEGSPWLRIRQESRQRYTWLCGESIQNNKKKEQVAAKETAGEVEHLVIALNYTPWGGGI